MSCAVVQPVLCVIAMTIDPLSSYCMLSLVPQPVYQAAAELLSCC